MPHMSGPSLYTGVLELARTLIAIPSVNPLLTDDPSVAGEHRMADFLSDYLDRRGFRIERYEITSGRPNVVASFGPESPGRTVMVEVHLDTQGIHGMTVPPFEGLVRDGRLYGRGACDMKGPMAAALVNLTPETLDGLASAGVRLLIAGAMGEETGNLGALELVDAGVGADETLVLEPTDLHVVHAHKGAFWFEVEVRGIAAHGSNPDKGKSAIIAMADVVAEIQRQTESLAMVHPLLGRPTVNIGTIRGGTSINIVPECCTIQVDRRTLPEESSAALIENLQGALDAMIRRGVMTSATIRRIKEGKPFATGADTRLVRRLGQSLGDHGIPLVTEGAAWYSDAGPFSRTSGEVAVFGPGSIRQAHTADEYIDIAELERGAAVIGGFFRLLAGEQVSS
ncbi:MAG TPA: M20 family metallopeptidase [Kiritimatiellia bacterium]|nr:M20 family metallopeptidase [Kiritimatiellia bacterium]HMO97746.1 M20 family metallopeptidase [Kiritimatiellia bacterium]HMP95385.1 M20 family metallopeptidase [Kiritimatiellia bacterium]